MAFKEDANISQISMSTNMIMNFVNNSLYKTSRVSLLYNSFRHVRGDMSEFLPKVLKGK